MQKALILALLVGAFFIAPGKAFSQETSPDFPSSYDCDEGQYENHESLGHICRAMPTTRTTWEARYSTLKSTGGSASQAWGSWKELVTGDRACESGGTESRSIRTESFSQQSDTVWLGSVTIDTHCTWQVWNPYIPGYETRTRNDYIVYSPVTVAALDPAPDCPPDLYQSLTQKFGSDSNMFCYKPATLIPDEPECDDIVGNCSPPDDEKKCFRGGGGQNVCFEKPEEKCTVDSVNGEPVYTNCQTGCGFINDNFVCSDEPEIPSLDDCLTTTNGYACPSDIPEADDNITDPDKPQADMKKSDFKDVLRGVETRSNATNKLISDQTARDAENTEKITNAIGKSNTYLKSIDKNTKDIAEGLEGLQTDGEPAEMGNPQQYKNELKDMLGITGDESIDDLTVGSVNIGELKDNFQFSLGSSACPPPRTLTIMGKVFHMDWEPFCEAFTILGYFIMAAAYVLATMIAFKGK